MTGDPAILVIDVGKTNAKLVLLEPDTLAELAATSTANPYRTDGPYPHADADTLWAWMLDGMADLARRCRIVAISITGHGASGALLSGDGLALPILDYEFGGPDDVAGRYREVRPDFAETLSPPLPQGLNLGAQLFWQQTTFPDAFAEADRFVFQAQYWAWKLTGVSAFEVSSAGAHTDLWNVRDGRLSTLVERQGWTRLMPPAKRADQTLGPVMPEIARQTGLDPSTPVLCGIHDSNAGLLPHLLSAGDDPMTVISTGTWAITFSLPGALDGLGQQRDCLANVDIWGRPVPSARVMAGREFALLTDGAAEPSGDLWSTALDLIGRGVMVLPTLTPGIGPFPNGKSDWREGGETISDPAGSLSGPERLAAASLYLALTVETSRRLTGGAGGIIVEGPFSENPVFCRALAAISGQTVLAFPSSTGTAFGAGLLVHGLSQPVPGRAPPERHVVADEDGRIAAYAIAWQAIADAPLGR